MHKDVDMYHFQRGAMLLLSAGLCVFTVNAAEVPMSERLHGLAPGLYQLDQHSQALSVHQAEQYLVELEQPDMLTQLQAPQMQVATAQLAAQNIPNRSISQGDWANARLQVQDSQRNAEIALLSRVPQAVVQTRLQQVSNLLVVKMTAAQASQVAQIPGVKAVWPDGVVQSNSQSVESDDIRKAAAMATTNQQNPADAGKGVRVAVLDSGVDYRHPALGGCLGSNCKVSDGYDFVDNDADPLEIADRNYGHGTAVAGIIAAKSAEFNGYAPEATLMAYRIVNSDGYGSVSHLLAALERAMDPDAEPTTKDGAHIVVLKSRIYDAEIAKLVNSTIDKIASSGVLVVAETGFSGTIQAPATARGALAVGASYQGWADIDSARGPGPDATVLKPEMVAEGWGAETTSLDHRLQYYYDSSIAAAQVAGSAAVLLSKDPQQSLQALRTKLINHSKAMQQTVFDHGVGELNLENALQAKIELDQHALMFGRINQPGYSLTGQKTFVVKNPGTARQQLNLKLTKTPAFFTGSLQPASFELAPGTSQTVTLQYQLDASKFATVSSKTGAAHADIHIETDGVTARIPAVFELYNSLTLTTDGNVSELRVFNAEWRLLTQQSIRSATEQVRINSAGPVHLLAVLHNFPKHLVPAVPEGQRVPFQSGLVLHANVDVVLKPELSIRNTDLIYRLMLDTPTLNNQSISAGRFKTSGRAELRVGATSLFAASFYENCDIDCAFAAPQQIYTNVLPDNAVVQISRNYLSQDLSGDAQGLVLDSQFSPVTATETRRINLTDQSRLDVRYKASTLQPMTLEVDSGRVGPLTQPGNLRLYRHATAGMADKTALHRVRLLTDKYGSMNFDSGYWQLSAAGLLERFNCPELESCWGSPQYNNLIKYSSSAETDLSFDSSLRYWSSALIRTPEYIGYKTEGAMFMDRRQNLIAPEYFGYPVTLTCPDQFMKVRTSIQSKSSSVDGLPETRWYNYVDKQCSKVQIDLVYGLVDPALNGTVEAELRSTNLLTPFWRGLRLFNRSGEAEIISRIQNQMQLELVAGQLDVREFRIELRAQGDNWQQLYSSNKIGLHQITIPQRQGDQPMDLRLSMFLQDGSFVINTIPQAFRLGASAGGDNDVDSDGILNSDDKDNDNDGVPDVKDAFPFDPNRGVDTDNDGIDNSLDPDDDNDGSPDVVDAFPLDAKEWLDTDKDGIGNNADPDDDNDGTPDVNDAFPLDPKETTDTDKDGIGNNADPDDDNDGVADSSDKYPLDASRSSDTVTPNTGSSGSDSGGGAGLGGLLLALPLLAWRRRRSQITDQAA
jgi:LPXTG-motif cell wall-anchored protein